MIDLVLIVSVMLKLFSSHFTLNGRLSLSLAQEPNHA
jgi:hypothetical protein